MKLRSSWPKEPMLFGSSTTSSSLATSFPMTPCAKVTSISPLRKTQHMSRVKTIIKTHPPSASTTTTSTATDTLLSAPSTPFLSNQTNPSFSNKISGKTTSSKPSTKPPKKNVPNQIPLSFLTLSSFFSTCTTSRSTLSCKDPPHIAYGEHQQ